MQGSRGHSSCLGEKKSPSRGPALTDPVGQEPSQEFQVQEETVSEILLRLWAAMGGDFVVDAGCLAEHLKEILGMQMQA